MVHQKSGQWILGAIGGSPKEGRYSFKVLDRSSGTGLVLDGGERGEEVGKFICREISTEAIPWSFSADLRQIKIEKSEVMKEMQKSRNEGTYFVLPCQLNGVDSPSPDRILTCLEECKSDEELFQRRGVRGSLAVHPALAQFLLDNGAGSCGLSAIGKVLDSISSDNVAFRLQLELEGRQVALKIGINQGAGFEEILPIFQTIDTVFVFIFLAELLLRIVVEQMKFMKDVANWLDTILVVGGLVDIFVSMRAQAEDMTTLRFVTALKAFRAIRMVRSFRFFRGLRGLVKACQCCLPSLCWSMVLLAVFMCMGGLIMGNLLQDYIKDESHSFEDRQWVWQRYGTCYRATYTLYEMTFAGNWPVNARPVMEKVNQGFVIFYLLYITIIVFAVIRVISAIFLKDTLDEAHNDAQQLVLDRLKKKADYVQRLEGLFRTIDASGQGMIKEERLQEILANPKVKAYFQTLEIDVHEGHALFHLLDNGDGEVTLEEFIDGLMRCKGPARAIDAVALHADLRQLDAKVGKLIGHLKQLGLVRSKSRTSAVDGRRHQAQNLKVFRIDQRTDLEDSTFIRRSS